MYQYLWSLIFFINLSFTSMHARTVRGASDARTGEIRRFPLEKIRSTGALDPIIQLKNVRS